MSTSPGIPDSVPMSEEEFRWKVTHTGRISTAVLFGAAVLCFIGRLCVRLGTRKRLCLDDCILLVAVGALCGATWILYKHLFIFFLMNAIFEAPEVMYTTWIIPYIEPLSHNNVPRNTFASLVWTAVFMVKFCFFAFFRPLIRNFRGLAMYYRICVAFTVMAYGLSISEGFVMNRYGSSPTQGLNYQWYGPSLAFTVSIALADIISDMMIVSIPVALLRNSSIRLSTKIGILSFLSLSIFMIICSIIRAAGFLPGKSRIPETSWRYLWQESEACIGVMMASITVFRTLLVSKHGDEERQDRPLIPSFVVKWYSNKRRTRNIAGRAPEGENGLINLPTIPSAIFTGIRSFIRRNHREGANTTVVESDFDPTEADYHAAIRGGPDSSHRTDRKLAEP